MPSRRRPSGWSSSTLLIPLRRRSTINAATRPSAARLRWAGAVGLRCPRYGTVQETLSATPKEAYGRYRELIRTARIEIFFSGCGSPDYAEEVFTKLFDGVERTPALSYSAAAPPAGGAGIGAGRAAAHEPK